MPTSPSELYKKKVFEYDRIRSRTTRRTRWERGKQLGLIGDLRPYKGFPEISRKIKERDNFTCQLCGRKSASEDLVVHHKNGIKTDHRDENLITVCHSCHRKLHSKKKPSSPK